MVEVVGANGSPKGAKLERAQGREWLGQREKATSFRAAARCNQRGVRLQTGCSLQPCELD